MQPQIIPEDKNILLLKKTDTIQDYKKHIIQDYHKEQEYLITKEGRYNPRLSQRTRIFYYKRRHTIQDHSKEQENFITKEHRYNPRLWKTDTIQEGTRTFYYKRQTQSQIIPKNKNILLQKTNTIPDYPKEPENFITKDKHNPRLSQRTRTFHYKRQTQSQIIPKIKNILLHKKADAIQDYYKEQEYFITKERILSAASRGRMFYFIKGFIFIGICMQMIYRHVYYLLNSGMVR